MRRRREIWNFSCRRGSAADADGAETENHVAAGPRTAKTQHGTEAREKQHLVKLAPEFQAVRAGENLIVGHVALGIDGDVQQEAVRQGKFEVVLLRRPGLRIIRKRNQLGGAHEIEGDIVLHGAHSDARHDHLEHQNENENGGEKSAGGRKSQGAENIIEQNFRAILDAADAAMPILQMLRLSSGNLDAHGQISRRNAPGYTRKHNAELAEFFQLPAANAAPFEVLPDHDALFDARSTGHSVIEIAREFGAYGVALHWTPS